MSGTITYDALNRKLSETVNYGPFSKTYSYSYDALSNKATYTSPEGKTYAYTYNKNNQPTSIVFDGKTIGLTYQWNRLTKATLPNNVITDYQYNANSWLNYITTKQGTTTHLDKKYDFDKVGNITKKTDDASIVTDYNYDSTYQLTSSTNPSLAETFTYDKTGNRLIAVLNSSTISYTHNANNEMTSADAATYSYDANGNTIQETNGTQITKYIYNSSNRLERVELPDGRIAEYKYDSFGRRISKTINNQTTYYLYSDEGLIGEYDSAGNNIKSYGWIPDSIWGTNPIFMLENNNYYFYHNDHLGTPQKMTDETGNVVWSAAYTAFGEATVDATSTITNNLRFAGQYFDEETGKHYNWNRYYDPKTGRYTQVDPIGFEAGDGNLYRYVFNLPLNEIDSLGLFNFSDIDSKTISDAIGISYWNPALGAYFGYFGLKGLTSKEIVEGGVEGIVYQYKRGYHKCFAICMAKAVGIHALVDITKGVLTEHPTSIAKIFTKTPGNLSKFKAWVKVISAKAADILKIGKFLDKLHPLFLAVFAGEAAECVKECLECPGSHDKLW